MSDFLLIIGVAGVAALASLSGGLIALWRTPTTMFMSLSLGFAGGILLGTISFKMLPEALQLCGLGFAVLGFAVGFLTVYAFDLYIHRGKLAGEKSEQHSEVEGFRRRHPPRGDKVTVLAGGTSAEEIIEGVSIGVGASIQPGLGLLIATAIAADNLAEGLSIGELVRSGDSKQQEGQTWRILGWTGLIGAALLASTWLAGCCCAACRNRCWVSCWRWGAAACSISPSPTSCPKAKSASISSRLPSPPQPASSHRWRWQS